MSASNTLDGVLSRIRQYAVMPQLVASLTLAPLLLPGQAIASQQNNPTNQHTSPTKFDPIQEYCKKARASEHPISLSEVLSDSDVPDKERGIILLLYNGLGREELYEMCLREYSK